MNAELNIDLQAFVKRTYFALLYNSTFYNFLNENYIGALRQTGAPIIEVIKGGDISKEAYTGDGLHINSDFLNGLNKQDAIDKMIAFILSIAVLLL